ncbi:protein-glutamine gamma-glutamyltransferase [Cohnella sp. GCM10027633]|uniref:protein-glutamine gamma-glutamyltransferase n=1 Tax=unclassified Cohnella TaxID=2636738 RepID=UPI003630DFA7
MDFENALRSNIIDAAKSMNKGGTRFATFRTSFCNEKLWILTNRGGFLLRNDATPARGINDIFSNGTKYGFECAVAIVILFYKGVLDTIGADKFNELFANLHLFSWDADSDLGITSARVGAQYARPGDCLYFRNPDVNPEKTEWQGENVILLEDGRYYGHGLGIRDADGMIAALNKHRKKDASRSAYLDDTIAYPDYDSLSQYAPPTMSRYSMVSRFPEAIAAGAVRSRIGKRRTIGV